MLQYDQQKINLETTLGTMSPIFKDSNKANNLKIWSLRWAGIPFYKATMIQIFRSFFRKVSEENFKTIIQLSEMILAILLWIILKVKFRLKNTNTAIYDFKGLFRKQRKKKNIRYSGTRKFLFSSE
jgi:hypothetical protein